MAPVRSVAPPWAPLAPAEARPSRPQRLAQRALIAGVAGLVGVVVTAMARVPSASDRRTALAAALGERGLVTVPGDVVWVDPVPGVLGAAFGTSRAVVRAQPAKGEPSDIFLVETRLSPSGVLLAVGGAFDLTDTSGADESRPVVAGERVGFAARPLIEGASPTAHVLDLSGQGPAAPEWSRVERLQNAITNWQQTGQSRGIARRTFAIDGEPKTVAVTVDNGALAVAADDRRGLLGDGQSPGWLRGEDVEVAKPGNLTTWAVDRVRAIPWIGDDTMQSVKALAFTALDFVLRNKEAVTGDTGEEGIAEDLGQNKLDPPTKKVPVDPEMGWPPPPLEAWVTPALPGEGQWNSLEADPFVRKNPGLPGAFVTTFVRTDRTRKATRVYLALWDPRQIELHMMAGTVEPKSATGEAGPGLIPRSPEVMKRVVAASNAGFQALHGEFGMMADGVVYLPPKPYAATVAALKDGTTAFGTWPNSQTIPEEVRSYRQNMTVMVQDEKFNPYGRTWWGGTVPGAEDKTHTVRTGICQTREGFVAYFYGADISPDALAQAMIQARCKYGLALDMNAGHAGLEFYNVQPTEEYQPLDRHLSHDWEAEGTVPAIDGFKFRSRRFIRGMGLMNFPRYIKREARDFFYMTLRPVLPGAAVPGGADGAEPGKDGAWRVKGLPQHGFPYALALTEVGPAGGGLRVLKIDPRTVHPAAGGDAEPTVAVLDAGPAPGAADVSLWHSQNAFSIGDKPAVAGAVRIASGKAEGAHADAAVGIADEDGMLVYVERAGAAAAAPKPAGSAAPDASAPGGDSAPLLDLLGKLGCSTRIVLGRSLSPALGGDTGLAGEAVHAASGAGAVRLARSRAPGVQRIFEDTPVVPFKVWYPLQQHRVRYFKKPAEAAPEDE